MKNFIEDDEESYDDSFSSDEEEIDFVNTNVIKKKKDKKFDEDDFDVKVAKSIVKIHKKDNDVLFSKWVEENFTHLKNLYNLSELQIPPEVFYTYLYDNSKMVK